MVMQFHQALSVKYMRSLHRPSASKVFQDHYTYGGNYYHKYHVDELLQIRYQALGLVPEKLEIRVFDPSLVPFTHGYLEFKIGIPELCRDKLSDQL